MFKMTEELAKRIIEIERESDEINKAINDGYYNWVRCVSLAEGFLQGQKQLSDDLASMNQSKVNGKEREFLHD